MKRYVAVRPRSDDDYWWRSSDFAWHEVESGQQSVIVNEQVPDTFSGLYDHDGNELHRERPPLGFRLKS